MPNLPEFSTENYNIARYVIASLITVSGVFLIYEVLFNSDLTFAANWNMFKSPLGNICMFIGLLCAIIFWGKMGHWSRTPVIEYRDRSGRLVGAKEDMDITEQSFAKILLPIIGHFVIEPIIYGALIYYPIQCVIAFVGTIFPYVLTLVVIAIIAGSWLLTKNLSFRYRSLVLVLMGLLFTGAFTWSGYTLHNAEEGSTIQTLVEKTTITANANIIEPTNQGLAENENNLDETTSTIDKEEDDQFEGVGEEGLFGSLPIGTTEYVGDMAGFPIEFSITKKDDSGDVSAIYKNVKYSTVMNLSGESLPAMGGDINLYGNDNGTSWTFCLTGTIDTITGTAQSGEGKEMKVTLQKR